MKPLGNSTRLTVAALLSLAPSVIAGPGKLDPGFNKYGHIAVGGWQEGGANGPNRMAVMKDGRIIVAGQSANDYHDDLLISRHLPDGAHDTSFDGGSVSINMDIYDAESSSGPVYQESSDDKTTAVAVQPDGKILVAGYYVRDFAENDQSFSFLIRLNEDGSFDDSFGEDGRVVWESGVPASSIIVLENGKILLGGNRTPAPESEGITVTRLNADGTEDPSFLGNGEPFRPGNLAYPTFADMTLQPDGKIVVVGASSASGVGGSPVAVDSFVMRLTAQGELDSSFDGDGYLEAVTPKIDYPVSVVVRPDGRILVGGTIIRNAATTLEKRKIQAYVNRYTSTGALDTSFSGDGKATYTVGVGSLASMHLQQDGKIVFVGSLRAGPTDSNIGILRLSSTGVVDRDFGSDGVALTDFGWQEKEYEEGVYSSFDEADEAELLPDGKLLVVGTRPRNGFLARFSMLTQTDARVGSKASATKGNNIYNNSGAGQTLSLFVKRDGGKKTSYVRIQNDGTTAQPFLIQCSAGDNALSVRYLKGKEDVTGQVIDGVYKTGNLAPGASHLLKVEITASTKAAGKFHDFSITARAYNDLGSRDTVLLKAASK